MNNLVKQLWPSRRIAKIILITFAILLVLIVITEIIKRTQPESTRSSRTTTQSSSRTTTTEPSSTTQDETAQNNTKPQEAQSEPTPQVAQPEPTPQETQPEPQEVAQPQATPSQTLQPAAETATPSCWHYVSSRCYDDLEDEAAAAGYYDRLNGDYEGRSFDYPDDCNAECQDVLEEAYYDGYYDY